MAKDRALDRHHKPNRSLRLNPPDLWERLGEEVGERARSVLISELVARFLDGRPMPRRPWVPGKSGQRGQDRAT